MEPVILMTLTVLIAYAGARRELVHYLGTLDLEVQE